MIGRAMAGKGAVAAGGPRAHEFQAAIGRGRNVVTVEIHQAGLPFHAVRIVASHARCLLVHNVETMPPLLAEAIDRVKTLVAQNAVPAVALVTEGIIGGAFRVAIGKQNLSLKEGREH